MRLDDVFQRLLLWNKHRTERRMLGVDPQAFSIESVYAKRDRWANVAPGLNLSEEFRRALELSAPKGWLQDSRFWDVFVQSYQYETRALLERAKALTVDRFILFQQHEKDMGAPVRWSATMEPGGPEREWPDDYYADIHFYHDQQRPDLDVKWCWELNRFQHLLCLGAAWRISGEERYALKAREHLESWMARVIYPRGVQWSSNLEVGLRALSWARCHVLCMNSRTWDREFVDRFLTCLYIQTAHLARELTVHHAKGNHLLGEASALFQLAILYPVFTESSRWRDRSVRIIDYLVPKLIHPDGVYAEQSTGYFRFIAEFLLPVLHLAQYHRIALSGTVLDRLTRGMDFIEAISLDARDVPMIGDSDTGLAIGWNLSDYWDFRPLSSAADILLKRPGTNRTKDAFPAESFLISGLEGMRSFQEQRATPSASIPEGKQSKHRTGLSAFPAGGYQVSSDNSFCVIFDAGQLGISPGFGHGHADGLAFQMSFHGKQVITDTGTMLYNGDERWRNYFRGTRAHNTVAIDGQDQSEPLSTFRWAAPLDIKLCDPVCGDCWRLLRGSLGLGAVKLERAIVHVLERAVVILDSVAGPDEHLVEWFLHFLPDWTVEQPVRNLFRVYTPSDCLEILILGSIAGEVSVMRGSQDPRGGWYSRYYGVLEAASCIRIRLTSQLPVNTAIVIKPAGKPLELPEEISRRALNQQTFSLLSSDAFLQFSQQGIGA